MMDFTLKGYQKLLKSLHASNFKFVSFSDFINEKTSCPLILRHDVDLLPDNSLRFAQVQYELGIRGSYYFRAVPESWDEYIIKEIHELGHEVGYHYESLTTCKGNMEAAIKDFETNLEKLRKLVPVSTICMHGSPRSPYDSKDLWKQYNYCDYGIIGEPYFDVDFSEVFYITDTGRRWDGDKVSVRDKVLRKKEKGKSYHGTQDIIDSIEAGTFPKKVMFTFHPQRWTDNPFPWVKELVMQNVKNVVKRYFFVK